MSHYAKIENNIVVDVIVAEQDFINQIEGEWVQTSYNTIGGTHYQGGTPLRKNYAGIGMIYDRERDAFRTEQPYNSWMLNEDSCIWEAPIPYPNDGNMYYWDEDNKEWILNTIAD
jgi:hypothetical protein